MEESSKAFQNRTSYNLKVPKKQTKALVEDVEFSNMPKANSNKKGLLDSLFSFFKGDEKPKNKKPKRRYNSSKSKPNLKRNLKSRKPRKQMRKSSSKSSFKPKSNPKDNVKKQNGNVKKLVKESIDKPIDDDIGNRKEPTNKTTKKSVRRAKNDPRSRS